MEAAPADLEVGGRRSFGGGHGPADDLPGARAGGLHRDGPAAAEVRAGIRLEATEVYDPFLGTTSPRDPRRPGGGGPGNVRGEDPALRGGRGLRTGDQPSHRGRTGSTAGWRRGSGRRCSRRWCTIEAGSSSPRASSTYVVPSATEIPPIRVEHLETPAENNVGGFRGIGEGGTIGAPAAIANAISDALAPLGVEIEELPATPDRLYRLIADCPRAEPRPGTCESVRQGGCAGSSRAFRAPESRPPRLCRTSPARNGS